MFIGNVIPSTLIGNHCQGYPQETWWEILQEERYCKGTCSLVCLFHFHLSKFSRLSHICHTLGSRPTIWLLSSVGEKWEFHYSGLNVMKPWHHSFHYSGLNCDETMTLLISLLRVTLVMKPRHYWFHHSGLNCDETTTSLISPLRVKLWWNHDITHFTTQG